MLWIWTYHLLGTHIRFFGRIIMVILEICLQRLLLLLVVVVVAVVVVLEVVIVTLVVVAVVEPLIVVIVIVVVVVAASQCIHISLFAQIIRFVYIIWALFMGFCNVVLLLLYLVPFNRLKPSAAVIRNCVRHCSLTFNTAISLNIIN